MSASRSAVVATRLLRPLEHSAYADSDDTEERTNCAPLDAGHAIYFHVRTHRPARMSASVRPRTHMLHEDYKMFESEGFLLQIGSRDLLYAEKCEVRFNFKNITKLRIYRQSPGGKISKIIYRIKGQLSAFQIDGFGEAEMEEIANLLKARAMEHSIPISER